MDGRPRIRHSIQLEVEPESERRLQRIKSQLQHVKSVLRITSRTPMGNLLMIEKLLQVFQEFGQSAGMGRQTPLCSSSSEELIGQKSRTRDVDIQTDILPPYILASGDNTTGCFDIHTPSKPVEDYFIASNDALQRLVATMAGYDGNCPLCGFTLDLQSFAVKNHGHTARTSISCIAGHYVRWYSSSTVAGKFTANLRCVLPVFLLLIIILLFFFSGSVVINVQVDVASIHQFPCIIRMVHGFTCSGLTETQYINSCQAARIGHVEQQYIFTGNIIFISVFTASRIPRNVYNHQSKCNYYCVISSPLPSSWPYKWIII